LSPRQTICTDRRGSRRAAPPLPSHLSSPKRRRAKRPAPRRSGRLVLETRASPGNTHGVVMCSVGRKTPQKSSVSQKKTTSRKASCMQRGQKVPADMIARWPGGYHGYQKIFWTLMPTLCQEPLPGCRDRRFIYRSPADIGQRRLVKMATRAINRVNTPRIKRVFNRHHQSLCVEILLPGSR